LALPQWSWCREAARGFINLFDDYLAPQLMATPTILVDLI